MFSVFLQKKMIETRHFTNTQDGWMVSAEEKLPPVLNAEQRLIEDPS